MRLGNVRKIEILESNYSMKAIQTGIALVLVVTTLVSCAHKKNNSALLFFLLGLSQTKSQPTTNSGENESPITDNTNPVSNPTSQFTDVTLETFSSGNSICPNFGGVLLRYLSGTNSTCGVTQLSADCAKEAAHIGDSSPFVIDPRSITGYSFPIQYSSDTVTYPSDGKSLAYCFNRSPSLGSTVKMEAYRNRTSVQQECIGTKIGQLCTDRISILSPTKFRIPAEFPIVSEGRSDGHWSQLKYITPEGLFVVCRYAGEVTSTPILSYRSSVVDQVQKKGYCVTTTGGYYDSETAVWVSEEIVPVGREVTAITEVVLEVNNCANKTFTKIEWNIGDWVLVNPTYLPLEAELAGIFDGPMNVWTAGATLLIVSILLFWRKKQRKK